MSRSSALANSLALLNELKGQINQNKQKIPRQQTPSRSQIPLQQPQEKQSFPVRDNIPKNLLGTDQKNQSQETLSRKVVQQSQSSQLLEQNKTKQISQFDLTDNFISKKDDKQQLRAPAKEQNNYENEAQQNNGQEINFKSFQMAEEIRQKIKNEIQSFTQECNDVQNKISKLLQKLTRENIEIDEDNQQLEDQDYYQNQDLEERQDQSNSSQQDDKGNYINDKNFDKQFDKLVLGYEEKVNKSNSTRKIKQQIKQKKQNKSDFSPFELYNNISSSSEDEIIPNKYKVSKQKKPYNLQD